MTKTNTPNIAAQDNGVSSERQLLMQQVETTYSGPLPPASELKAYGQIVENGAERIFATYEKQVAHRLELENKAFEHDSRLERQGQVFGFVSVIAILSASVAVAFAGFEKLAAVLIGTCLIGIASIFVLRKLPFVSSRNNEVNNKQQHE